MIKLSHVVSENTPSVFHEPSALLRMQKMPQVSRNDDYGAGNVLRILSALSNL